MATLDSPYAQTTSRGSDVISAPRQLRILTSTVPSRAFGSAEGLVSHLVRGRGLLQHKDVMTRTAGCHAPVAELEATRSRGRDYTLLMARRAL